jgi:hypothetical protein
MTWAGVASRVKVKGWLVHEAWITFFDEYVAKTYWTVTLSPAAAAGPVPTIRSELSKWVGGAPEGTVTEGSFPGVPAGDRSDAGMGGRAPAVG